MTTTTKLPRRIWAWVSQDALRRVSRMFDSTEHQRLTEILQNARRAGATAIEITTSPERTTVRDNGSGIDEPGVILRMGASGWDSARTRTEDPAGMGFFSLAKSGCRIQSAPANGPAWQAVLTPGSFKGEDVEIRPWTSPTGPGTIVSWPGMTNEGITATVVRYLPVKVTVNGKAAEQTDYLAGNIYETTWEGFRLGVFPSVNRKRSAEPPSAEERRQRMDFALNFHGLVINGGLPQLDELEGPLREATGEGNYGRTSHEVWRVRVDVAEGRGLELLLPERKMIISNERHGELAEACRQALYDGAVRSGRRLRLGFADWERARAAGQRAGIAVPAAEAVLEQWRPMEPGYGGGGPPGTWTACRNDSAIVVEEDIAACDEHVVAEAARRSRVTLVRGNPRLAGYTWYDELPRLAGVDAMIEEDGRRWRVSQVRAVDNDQRPSETIGPEGPTSRQVDSIAVEADIRYSDGRRQKLSWPSNVAFARDEASYADEIEMLIAKGSVLRPHEAAEMATAAYFYPSEDFEADAADTQRETFTGEALSMTTRVLADAEEALKERLRYEFERGVGNYVPFDRTVTITKRPRGEVEVTIHDKAEATGP